MRRDISFGVGVLAAALRGIARRCVGTRCLPTISLAVCGFLVPVFAAAQSASYKVEKSSGAPPAELSAAVRDALGTDELRVSAANGVLCEVWLRKSVPPAANPAKEFGVTFGQIPEGTLIGAMRLSRETQDYRNQTIPAGVYTLRYALIPVDGNHLGIAAQRDFLLIGTAAKDADPATLTRDQTLDLSREASGTGHPSVWSLGPPDSGAAALPSVVHQQGNDAWAVEFNLNLASGTVPMALVIAGHAPDI